MLAALGDQLGRGAGAERLVIAALPRTPGDVLQRLVATPQAVADHVRDDSDIEGLLLGSADEGEQVYACHVQREASEEHPLGAESELGQPLPAPNEGARWIVSDEDDAMALVGDVLVVSSSREAVQSALGWLKGPAFEAEAGDGATLSLSPAVVSRSLHSIAAGAVDRWAENAHRDLAEERTRHDAAAQVADPEVALREAETHVRSLVALLPDVGATEISLRSADAGLAISLRLEVRPESPLAARVAQLGNFETARIASLPPESALRIVAAAWPNTGDGDAPSLVASLVGDRLEAPARAALERWMASLDDGEGTRALALGAGERGPMGYYFGHAARPVDRGAMARALEGRWLRQGVGFALGCDPDALGYSTPLRCPDGPRELAFASAGATRVVALRPVGEDEPLEAAAAHFEAGEHGELDPTTERLLSAMPPRAFAALWLDAAGVSRALSPGGASATSAPMMFAAAAEESRLRAQLVLAPGAGAKIVGLLLPALR